MKALIFLFSFLSLGVGRADTGCLPQGSSAAPFQNIKEVSEHVINEACDPKFIAQMLSRRREIAAALHEVVKEDTQVVAVGEYHTFGAGRDGYAGLIKELADAGFKADCLTVEIRKEETPVLQEAMKTNTVDRQKLDNDSAVPQGPGLGSSLQAARDRGLKVFAIDKGMSWNRILEESIAGKTIPPEPSVAERNVFMAEGIRDLARSNTCKKIIHIGGLAHLSLPGDEKENLGAMIQANGQKTVTLALAPTNDIYSLGDFAPTPLRCSPDGAPLNQGAPFAIVPDKRDWHFMTKSTGRDPLLWRDLDAVLFLPPRE